MTTWGGSNAVLGSMAVAPDGNVVLLGEIQQSTIDKPPPVLFLVKFAAPAPPEGQIAGGEQRANEARAETVPQLERRVERLS